MFFLYFFIGFCIVAILVIIFFWIIPTIVRLSKGKNLQNASDIAFTNVNDRHTFKYAIKRFRDTNVLKIILIVEIPVSEIGKMCLGLGAVITLTDLETNQEYDFNYTVASLEPNFSVDIPSSLSDKKFKVNIVTRWNFASCVETTVEEQEFEI